MLAIHAEEGEGSGQPFEPQPTPSPAQSFHEEQVLDLEKAMTAQAKEIAILKKRVKKLEKRKRSRTQGLKLFKIGTSKRRSLDKEDASKHEGNLNARLISEEDDFDDGFDVVRDEGKTHVEGDTKQVVIATAEVVNAGVSVSTAKPKTPPTITTTTLLEDYKVTVAATLVQMSETSKAKSILDDKRAGLEEAMRLQAEQEAEHVEQIHLDHLLAQRMQEEQEMTKQQKKRQAKVLESTKYYTEEDWDIIRANIKSNAELSKILLGENEPGEDFGTRIHQGSWTFAQLKKLSDEEIKAKYKRLVRSIENFVPMGAEVKEVPITKEPGKLGQSTTKEDEEYEKEKEELSLFLIIAFDEHKELDYKIPDQRSSIIAWNSEYYGPKSLHDKVKVPEEINMNIVTRLNGSKRYFSVLFRVLSIFDKDDLSALYQLVIDKYQDEIPEGFDLILCGDLTIMFHPNEEDDF
ncbi:hypothetical protein Tco_0629103 [Tanacetum coccineum]|uniref:Myb-like domain-containing protein n=1 Tax=Tanacetum coccineum TaxID=301880 RepID=A0ABQ4WSX6_9ASTR